MKAKDAEDHMMSISFNHRSHINLIFFSLQVNLDNSSQSATPAAFFIFTSPTPFPYS